MGACLLGCEFWLSRMTVVLVTGGTGMVGKALKDEVDRLQAAGERKGESWIFLGSKDGDLRDEKETRAIFEKYKPTKVIHLAARVGGLYFNLNSNVEMFRDNGKMSDNILTCCHDFKVEKLVNMLSTCIFPGELPKYPFQEDALHTGPPHFSNEGYGMAKRNLEILSRLYRRQYGDKFVSVIPTNIYGEYDEFGLDRAHVVPGLIHKCYLAKEKGSDFVVWGSGTPLRQFLYAPDVAKLTIWALDKYDEEEPILFSPGAEGDLPIKDIAVAICEAMGLDISGQLKFDTSKSDGLYRKTAGNDKLRRLYPEFEFTPLPVGLKKVCEYFCEHYDTTIRK